MKKEKTEKVDILESDTSRSKDRLKEAKRTEKKLKEQLTTIKIQGGYIQTTNPRKWQKHKVSVTDEDTCLSRRGSRVRVPSIPK